jgi:hypothetical protein
VPADDRLKALLWTRSSTALHGEQHREVNNPKGVQSYVLNPSVPGGRPLTRVHLGREEPP